MARGMVVGEPVVSQANTKAYAEGYERIFGKEHKPQRGRWSFGASDTTERAVNAPIIADRIHEGTTFHDGDRVRDLGSRAKRRQFFRETGLTDASDFSPQYREAKSRERERAVDRRIDESAEAAARKLYHQGKWRE